MDLRVAFSVVYGGPDQHLVLDAPTTASHSLDYSTAFQVPTLFKGASQSQNTVMFPKMRLCQRQVALLVPEVSLLRSLVIQK